MIGCAHVASVTRGNKSITIHVACGDRGLWSRVLYGCRCGSIEHGVYSGSVASWSVFVVVLMGCTKSFAERRVFETGHELMDEGFWTK